MALFRSIGARKDATRGTAPVEVRKGLANVFTGAGVLPGATSPLVAGTADWAYSVGAAGFVSTRGASDGVHLFGNDGTVTIGTTGVGSTVPVAPGAGLSRIDIIWVKHPSASENSDTISEPSFGVTSGTAASVPVAPTLTTGQLELARNTMTSAATTTASAGNTITQTAAKARLRGQQTPAKGVRGSDATLAIETWHDAASVSYTFEVGGWYLINGTGYVSIGTATSDVRHRILAAGLDVSIDWLETLAPSTKRTLSAHYLFTPSVTATVTVSHQVYVPAPSTGIIVAAGHIVSVARVA